jgi:heat shock protein HslJ
MKRSRLRLLLVLGVLASSTIGCTTTEMKRSEAALDGTAWVLAALPGGPLPIEAVPTLAFDAARASGSDGCNRYFAQYTSAPNGELQFGLRGGTQMACPQEQARLAEAFGEALNATRGYRNERGQLLLLDGDGTVLATFDPQATALAGTSWRVSAYNNGKQAVVSVLGGSLLTLQFAGDDGVRGSAGCNDFSGSYHASGRTLSFGPLVTTRKACAAPAGVMAQEIAFLNALQSTASVRREGQTLELRTASGALAAMLLVEAAAKP